MSTVGLIVFLIILSFNAGLIALIILFVASRSP